MLNGQKHSKLTSYGLKVGISGGFKPLTGHCLITDHSPITMQVLKLQMFPLLGQEFMVVMPVDDVMAYAESILKTTTLHGMQYQSAQYQALYGRLLGVNCKSLYQKASVGNDEDMARYNQFLHECVWLQLYRLHVKRIPMNIHPDVPASVPADVVAESSPEELSAFLPSFLNTPLWALGLLPQVSCVTS